MVRRLIKQWLGAITTVQRDDIPQPELYPGDQIWNLTAGELQVWNGTVWVSAGGGTGSGPVLMIPEDYPQNPIQTIPTSNVRSVLYFPSGFNLGGTPYKYVFIHADDNTPGAILVSGSNDFITWAPSISAIGLAPAALKPCVVQLGPSLFRIYYHDSALLYQVQAMRTAISIDLINWTDDVPLQNGMNPIVTGLGVGWNRGTYGPCYCFFNPAATNTGLDPHNYSYMLYYDGTDGAFESIGLGYSADGVTFELYGSGPNFDHSSTGPWGNPNTWDSSYATLGQIIILPDGRWLMFYAGGQESVSEGIGAAISNDKGLSWSRLSISAPLIAPDPATWRKTAMTAPTVVADFTGRFAGAGEEADVKLIVSGGDAPPVWQFNAGYMRIFHIIGNSSEVLYRAGKV